MHLCVRSPHGRVNTLVCYSVMLSAQVAANQSGSLVYKIDPLAPAHDVLKENDVVMEIDRVPIADDGTVEFRNEERVEFSHIVRAKHIGMGVGAPPQGISCCSHIHVSSLVTQQGSYQKNGLQQKATWRATRSAHCVMFAHVFMHPCCHLDLAHIC